MSEPTYGSAEAAQAASAQPRQPEPSGHVPAPRPENVIEDVTVTGEPAVVRHRQGGRGPGGRGPGGTGDRGGPFGGGGGLPTRRRFGAEPIFRGFTTASGTVVLIIIAAIAAFLIVKAIPALRADKVNFLTYRQWFPDPSEAGQPSRFGIGALAFGTVLTSALALVMAVPVALGIALCLSHYAPKRLATALGFVIDLLAAVPSIIFGLWGREYLIQPVRGLSAWLHRYFGWIPLFGGDGPYGKSVLLGSLVLAIMVLPIVTSLSREVFRQTPAMNEEAALALGATKWEMVRTAVLPYGRPGLIASVMLGLGRALGETIALALVLGNAFSVSFDIIDSGGNTIAANIANRFGDAQSIGVGALIASGLVLFAITLVVNMIARGIVYRRREFLGSAT
jgi:phosphate transport system permease protein